MYLEDCKGELEPFESERKKYWNVGHERGGQLNIDVDMGTG